MSGRKRVLELFERIAKMYREGKTYDQILKELRGSSASVIRLALDYHGIERKRPPSKLVRKIVGAKGTATLTVTIPQHLIKKHGLRKGMLVEWDREELRFRVKREDERS